MLISFPTAFWFQQQHPGPNIIFLFHSHFIPQPFNSQPPSVSLDEKFVRYLSLFDTWLLWKEEDTRKNLNTQRRVEKSQSFKIFIRSGVGDSWRHCMVSCEECSYLPAHVLAWYPGGVKCPWVGVPTSFSPSSAPAVHTQALSCCSLLQAYTRVSPSKAWQVQFYHSCFLCVKH